MNMKTVKAINIPYDQPVYKILDYIHFNGAEAIAFSEMLNYRITNYEIEFKVDDNISSYVSPIGVIWNGGDQYYNEPTNYVYVQMTPGNNGNYYTGRFMAGNTNVTGQNYGIVKTSDLLTTAPKFDFVWNELVSGNTYRYGYRNFATTTSSREGGLGRMQTRTAADFQGFYIGSCLVINYNGSTFTRSHTYDFKGNIYSFKYNDGVSVYNMVPAQRVSDSVCGLYDLDSGEFRAMVGTTITDGAAGNLVRYITTHINASVKKIVNNSGNTIWGSYDAFPYRRLEYIQFNGNDYINTGFTPWNNFSYYLDIQWDQGAVGQFSGHGKVVSNNRCFIGTEGGGKVMFGTGAYTSEISNSNVYERHKYLVRTGPSSGTGVFDIDGVQKWYGASNFVESNRGTMFIGGVYRNTGDYSLCNAKIYNVRFTNNAATATTWTWNLIPVQRKSDGVIGFLKLKASGATPDFMTSVNGLLEAGPVLDEYWDMTDPF